MATNIMHPALSQLLPLEKIPNELESIRDALASVFDDVYVKHLIVGKSFHGDSGFYSLTLTTYNSLGLNIPFAQDLKLALNPTNQGTTEIPINFDYSWLIIKYIKEFSLDSFDNSVRSVLDILIDLAEITPKQLLHEAIYTFYPEATSLEDFVFDFNNNYGENLSISNDDTLTSFQKVDALSDEIEELDLEVVQVIYESFLELDIDNGTEKLKQLFSGYFSNIENNIKEAIKLNFNVEIEQISAGLQFPRKWLQPVYTGTQNVQGLEINDVLPEGYFSNLVFNAGSLHYSSQRGFQFNQVDSFELNRSMIANTGLIAEFSNLKLDLKRGENITEAIIDGRPDNFMGVYAEYVAVTLPKKWFKNVDNTTLRVAGYNMLIGTGGTSGTIALETVNGTPKTDDDYLDVNIGSWKVGFKSFDLTFKQNQIVESNILGRMIIPRLQDADGNIAQVDIVGHLDDNGDFLVTASEKDGFKPLSLPNVVDITIHTLELGKQDDNYFIGVSCDLLFTNQIMKKLLNDQPIKVPRVRVYDDGSFEIVSGVIEVPTNFTLDLGPVEVAITNINFGSYQQEYQGKMRRYNVFGFDGGISVNPIGVDARGEGIKYYYTTDDNTTDANGNPLPPDHPDYKPHHSYIRIQTIRVDLVIPGNASAESATAIIKGYLSIGEDEYIGGVSLKLPKAKIAGSAEMRLKPKYPAFIVDASLEIPTPLPLGSTGLGVYGFRGILGFRYVAEKEAIGLTSGEDTWYDYYTYPPRGINISKFSTPEVTGNYKNPISLGAGASIATYGNDDIISFRVMLLLSIPSLFMIEGKASIISKRYGLDDSGEPPFFAFLAIGDNSIEAGAGADFKLPQNSGKIFDLYAEVQAGFFFKNPSAWYVNVGAKDKPISARVLTLVTAESYLMLSATGIEAGARASFEFDKRFGPVRVRATLAVAIGGYVSFERPQFGAYFAIKGGATVDVKIISVGIDLDLILSAEAPKPFLIYGKFRLCVSVKVVFVRIRFCGNVELKWEKSRSIDRTPIAPLLPEQTDTVKAVHMLNGEAFDLIQLSGSITNPNFVPDTDDTRFNTNVIPVDSYIDIKFDKAMLPQNVAAKIGGVNNPPEGYTDLIPPKKVVNGKTVRQVKHLYSVEEVEIKAAVGNNWVDYNPYEALDSAIDTSNLKLGQWQKSSNEYNAIRLLGNSPFSYTEQAEPEWFIPEQIGITAASLFCQGTNREKSSSNWLKQTLNRTYIEDKEFRNQRAMYLLKGGSYVDVDNNIVGGKATVTNITNVFNFEQSLQFDNNNQLEILLPEEAASVTITMTTFSQAVRVQFFASKINGNQYKPSFVQIDEKEYSREELKASAIEYTGATPILKVVITPKFPDLEAVKELQEKIRALYVSAYNQEIQAGNTQVSNPPRLLDLELLYVYNNQLKALLEVGCSVCSNDDIAGGIGRMQVGNTLCVGGTPTTNTDCEGETRCYTLLHEVCWLNVEDYEFNLNIPQQDAIQQDYQSARDAITKVIAPVWRPNTKYYVHFKLKDTVDNGNSEGIFDYYYGFRTAGPVGHFHRDAGSTYGDIKDENNSIIEDSILNPDKYLLTSLRGYIDYNRSYPNADGNLLRAKPLFYGKGELAIFFTNPATYHMFTNWPAYKGMPALDAELKFFVKDPVTNEIIVNPLPPDVDVTTIPETIETWSVDNEPLMPTHIQTLNNFVKEQLSNPDLNCVLDGGELIKPASKFMTVTFKNNLKPLKMYNALVNNVFNGVTREVHNYVFQTSRYLNFEEQVNSYKLKDINGKIRDAIFTIEVDTAQESIQSAYNSIAGIEDINSKNLELQYLDIFDRITEGLLNFKPIDPPETTEFNLLKDINTDKTIGVLIRNPEPFNDPKIPPSEVENSITILNEDGSVNEDYKGLYSKDLSQILFMKNTLEVSESSLDINFKYLKWNGNNYQIDSEVKISSINLKGK